MKQLAEWVYISPAKSIVWTVILCAFSFFISFSIASVFLMISAVTIVSVGILLIHRRLKYNSAKETHPPVCGDDNCLIFFDGDSMLKISCSDIIDIIGRNKKYFHYYGYMISWGTKNYGTLTVLYQQQENRQKLLIREIYEPQMAAERIFYYAQERGTTI